MMIRKTRIASSVILPIYNSSEYLQQALDSVINQTLPNIEIICINDGSTDSSLDIIHEYVKKDSRIVVVNKPNSGYGDSMNHGLDIAKGEYIAILEPDDWYKTNMLKTLYSLATQNNLDVAKCDFYQYSNQTKRSKQYHLFKSEQCSDILNENQTDFIYSLQPSIWSAIYRRSFLNKNNIRFLDTPGASYQDTSFNFKVFALAKRVMFIDKPLLYYRIDNSQSSINNIAKKLPYIDREYDEIDRFIIEHRLSDKLGRIAVECRYQTYVWAMEQLPISSVKRYIAGCTDTLKQSALKHDIDANNQNTHAGYTQLTDHVTLYTTKKICQLTGHRLKRRIIPNQNC